MTRVALTAMTRASRVWALRRSAYPSVKAGLTVNLDASVSACSRAQPGRCHPHRVLLTRAIPPCSPQDRAGQLVTRRADREPAAAPVRRRGRSARSRRRAARRPASGR